MLSSWNIRTNFFLVSASGGGVAALSEEGADEYHVASSSLLSTLFGEQ